MKYLSKNSFILMVLMSVFVVGGLLSSSALAATNSDCSANFIPSITIPGSKFQAGQSITINCSSVGEYIQSIYNFSVYAGGILAAIVLAVGGLIWLTAGGNVGQIGKAKNIIGGALLGFILLIFSWVLLNTINPALVEFKPLEIEGIENILQNNYGTCELLSDAEFPRLQQEAGRSGSEWIIPDTNERCEGQEGSGTCYCLVVKSSGACGRASGGLRCATGSGYICNKGFDCSTGTERPRIGEKGSSFDVNTLVGCCMIPQANGEPCTRRTDCRSGYCDNTLPTGNFQRLGTCADSP